MVKLAISVVLVTERKELRVKVYLHAINGRHGTSGRIVQKHARIEQKTVIKSP